MNARRLSGSGLAAAITFLLFLGCASCGSCDRDAPSDSADSTARQEASANAEVDPVQPDENRGVDLGRWIDMTRDDFDAQFADFTRSDPPVVRAYGICDSIICHFPSGAAHAVPEILVCNLDGVYLVADAFRLLGIEIGRVEAPTDTWGNVSSPDTRFSTLQFRAEGAHADRTSQILLQFTRDVDP